MRRKSDPAADGGFRSRIDRRLLVRVLAIGVTMFVLGYAVTALLFLTGGSRAEVVTVPELREMAVPEARRAVDRLGLELTVGDSLPHAQVHRGAVLAQSPLPGNEVAPGSAVRVIVSTGPERHPVPEVEALPESQANHLLSGAGFEVLVQQVPSSFAAGRVVGVQPGAGTLVPVPSTVRLLVSAGPPPTTVPDLRGMTEAEAATALDAAGLRAGRVDHDPEALQPPGAVVGQEPAAGESVHTGSAVIITVAGGDSIS